MKEKFGLQKELKHKQKIIQTKNLNIKVIVEF